MPLLQIDVMATDADGNVGTQTIEVEVAASGPPAAALAPSSASVSPPPLVTPPPLHEPPGMTTGGDGGQGSSAGAATPGDAPPEATRAERSQILFKNTGGFR